MISFLLHQSNYSFLTIGDLLTSTSPHRHFTRNYKILCLIITVFTKYVQNRHYHWFLSKDLRQFQSDFHGKHCRTSVDSSGILVRQKSVLFVLSGTWFTACLGVRWVDAYTWTAFLRPRGGSAGVTRYFTSHPLHLPGNGTLPGSKMASAWPLLPPDMSVLQPSV